MNTEWIPDICIYHAGCADGFTAAWAVWKRWPHILFLPASYGDAPASEVVTDGKKILIVDFSYKARTLDQLASLSEVIVLDHHKTAEAELSGYPHATGATYLNASRILARAGSGILTEFDQEHSGAWLAWQFCHPGEEVPDLVRYVEDRDLWRFALDYSRELNAFVASAEMDFQTWDAMADNMRDGRGGMRPAGAALLRKQAKDIQAAIDVSTRMMTIAGHRVPVANVPYFMASEAGNILAEGNPFAATYFDTADGRRRFSLRSDSGGIDVSEIAKAFGGGGHKHAAGFEMPRGWEGDPQ